MPFIRERKSQNTFSALIIGDKAIVSQPLYFSFSCHPLRADANAERAKGPCGGAQSAAAARPAGAAGRGTRRTRARRVPSGGGAERAEVRRVRMEAIIVPILANMVVIYHVH